MAFPTHIVAAGAIVENDQNEILLVKSFRRGWEFPGGIVEVGESITEGVLREVMEESSVTVKAERLIGIYSNICSHTWDDGVTQVPTKVMMDYVCKYISGDFAPSDETSDGMWVPKDRVLDYIEHPVYRYRYNIYLKNLDRPFYAVYKTKPFELISESIV